MDWSTFLTIVAQVVIGTVTVSICAIVLRSAFAKPGAPDTNQPDPLARFKAARDKRKAKTTDDTPEVPVAR